MINEPAFPMHETSRTTAQAGMTLLDYIAIEAMKELMRDMFSSGGKYVVAETARESYFMAEAMMKERKRLGICLAK